MNCLSCCNPAKNDFGGVCRGTYRWRCCGKACLFIFVVGFVLYYYRNFFSFGEKDKKKRGEGEEDQKKRGSVKVHMLVAGETFQAHETFMQKLKLQIELCSAESCNVILLFCPVVSRIGTDMEAAMDRVTVNKPVILVFMHHCHHPRHMTNTTMEPAGSNIVQVVHCAFHEKQRLLQCQENQQAVAEVLTMLQKYKQEHCL